MLAVVLVSALIAQSSLAAPSTNCAELCDDQNVGGYGQSKSSSSYSSYSKSSYGHEMQGVPSGGSGGLGLAGSRLENLDENVIGTSGLNRPGNWQDEKHFVTDDGRGQMSYRAGQTVSNNGFSKFAQHSYSYGSHESHAPLSNSQVLSTEQFGRELQNMRGRISNFMGNFHLDVGSNVNANLLQDFKMKADLLGNQLSSVCNQVDAGSSTYQQMQQIISQFHRDVDKKQREMENLIYQNSGGVGAGGVGAGGVSSGGGSSISSSSMTHGSVYHYPVVPSAHRDEQVSKVQSLITSFYSTFNRPDTNFQYQQDLNAQVDAINGKLAELSYESTQNESERARIDHLKRQFETYVGQIRLRIQEIERRNQEEETRRKDRELQLKLEKQQQEEKLRQEELLRAQQQEEERLRLQQQEEERVRLQHQEEERLRLQHQEEERLRLQHQEEERLQLQRKQDDDNRRARLEQEQQARLVLSNAQQSNVKFTGTSSTYEQSGTRGYGSPTQSASSGYTESYGYAGHTKPQPVIQPHVDLTAAMGRLQQDLNRLQSEVNNFNMYTMRLTSTNSVTVVGEAERQAEQLRERINNLCETSSRYQNQNVLLSAEDLGRHFEDLFRTFQSQAASYSQQGGTSSGFSASSGYSSESSYGSSGRYSSARAPTVSNVEYEHSKSVEVEVGRKPALSQSYTTTSGSAYGAASSYGARGVDGQFRSGLVELGRNGSGPRQVECGEMFGSQSCVEQPRRYRRHVGEREPNYFSDLTQQTQDATQQRQQISSDIFQYNQQVQLPREVKPIGNENVDRDSQLLQQTEDLSQKNVEIGQQSFEQPRNKKLNATHQIQENNFYQKAEQESPGAAPKPRPQPIRVTLGQSVTDQDIPRVQPLSTSHSNRQTQTFILEESDSRNYQQRDKGPRATEHQRTDLTQKTEDLTLGVDNLSQQHQSVQVATPNDANDELKHLSTESITERQKLLTTRYPIDVKPWQVGHILNRPLETDNDQQRTEVEHIDNQRSRTSQQGVNYDRLLLEHLQSHVRPSATSDKPNDYQKPLLGSSDVGQQHERVHLDENSRLRDLQEPRNNVQSNNLLRPTQRHETLYELNNNGEYNFENQQQRVPHNGNVNSRQFEDRDFNQQTQDISIVEKCQRLESQDPSTVEKCKQLESDLRHQKPIKTLQEGTLSSNKTKSTNSTIEEEVSTTPSTFWKRVGNKLSDSFNKVKEKAKSVFGQD